MVVKYNDHPADEYHNLILQQYFIFRKKRHNSLYHQFLQWRNQLIVYFQFLFGF